MEKFSDQQLIEILWNYMHLNHKLKKMDCIIVLGCSDISVVDVAVDIYKKGYSDKIIFSGGLGKDTSKIWNEPEAEKFAKIAIDQGIPKEKIYIENKSTNTGENFRFTKKLIEDNNLNIKTCIVVHKPYDERRAYATFKNWMPEYDGIVSSWNISMEDYDKYAKANNLPSWVNLMVGDVQRMRVFYEKGWQVKDEVPDNIWKVYEELVKRGYDEYVFYEK